MPISHSVRSYLQGGDSRAERDYMPELAGATLQGRPACRA